MTKNVTGGRFSDTYTRGVSTSVPNMRMTLSQYKLMAGRKSIHSSFDVKPISQAIKSTSSMDDPDFEEMAFTKPIPIRTTTSQSNRSKVRINEELNTREKSIDDYLSNLLVTKKRAPQKLDASP